MKRVFLIIIILASTLNAFAQRLSSVGILSIAAGDGVTGDVETVSREIIKELSSWGTLNILSGDQAVNAEYVVKSRIVKQGGLFILSASTNEARTGRLLNESREQAVALGGINIFNFCVKIVENVPYPNYLLGKWKSTINMPDGPVVCILEFRSNRTVVAEQYDTWEHKQRNALKYEGYGNGTYSYAGYLRRTMTVRDSQGNSRQIEVDATVGVNLKLEETLPAMTAVNQGGLRVLFNESKTAFDFVVSGLPCGQNYDGNAVYPSASVLFTKFTKIQ